MNSLLQDPKPGQRMLSPCDVTYGEALRIFWRLYWLPFLCSSLTVGVWGVVIGSRTGPVTVDVALLQLLSLPILAAFLLLFLPRIFKPFKGFTLTLAGTDNDPVTLSTARHIRVAGYMLMQLFLMGIVVTALQMPLNIFFGLFRLNMSTPVSLGCVIFLTGPYAMKMFVGHTFQDFRVDVKRAE